MACSGFLWLRMGTGGACERSKEPAGAINCGDRLVSQGQCCMELVNWLDSDGLKYFNLSRLHGICSQSIVKRA